MPRPGSPVPSTPERREGLRACYWEGPSELFFTFVVAVSRYFLADKLVTHITIEQFLPQKKPRHYEHVVLNVVDS